MSGTTKSCAYLRIDKLLEDGGWNLANGVSLLFEHALVAVFAVDLSVLLPVNGKPSLTPRKQGRAG